MQGFRSKITLTGDAIPVSPFGTPYLLFDALEGSESINELFQYHVIVRSQDEFGHPSHGYKNLTGYQGQDVADAGGTPGSHLNLQSLIGTEICITVPLMRKSLIDVVAEVTSGNQTDPMVSGCRYICGMVNKVEMLPIRNRSALYRLSIVPSLWLLTKRVNSCIYHHINLPDILNSVLENYAFAYELKLSKSYPALDYQVQYAESDFQFISRLMQEYGLNYHFEHKQDRHILIISDHMAVFQATPHFQYQELTLYPPEQRFPEKDEFVEYFEPLQRHTSGVTVLNDYQFKTPQLSQLAESKQVWDTQHNQLEVYEWQQGDYLSSDDGGQDKADLNMQRRYQLGYRAHGSGRLRGIESGFRFNLVNHPNIDSNQEWLVYGIELKISDVSELNVQTSFYDVSCRFLCQASSQVFLPPRTINKPLAPTQTAVVVGPAGEEIYTDQYGRVKVQFHWDRDGNKDESSTCWLRVASNWHGMNYGSVHLPRIGHEVIIDFFNHDPDMPYVSGSLTNPDNMPLWQLPGQKALSGYKSKEIGGGRNNHLIMDDTNGEIQVQLTSDHQLSQLNLGHITRIPDVAGRKDYRGEGFELRTDGWGVLRAGKGMLLTTAERMEGQNHHSDLIEAATALDTAYNQHKNLGKSAIDNKAHDSGDQDTVSEGIQQQNKSIAAPKGGTQEKSVAELSVPHLVLHSPEGIAITTEESSHMTTGKQLAFTAGDHVSISGGNSFLGSFRKAIRLFAQLKGIRLFAAKGKVEIAAQTDEIDILGQKKVKMHSNGDWVEITAKEGIIINGGTSYIKITAGGIEHGTNGSWKAHAGSHSMVGPKSSGVNIQGMPSLDAYTEQFQLFLPDGTPLQKAKYIIRVEDEYLRANTDEQGSSIRLHTEQAQEVELDLDWVELEVDQDDEEV